MLKALGIAAAGAAIATGGVTAGANASQSPSKIPAPTVSAPATPVGVSEHDNDVTFSSGDGLQVTFTWDTGYSITAGQPWGGVTTNFANNTENVDVNAGRSASTAPAQWLHARTTQPIGTLGAGPGGSGPTDLNFAISGTLAISGHQYPVVIGQGHTGYNNNWWVGGQGSGWTAGVTGPNPALTNGYLTTPDGLYTISTEATMSNQFGVTPSSLNN